jgi:hypothetical protein
MFRTIPIVVFQAIHLFADAEQNEKL